MQFLTALLVFIFRLFVISVRLFAAVLALAGSQNKPNWSSSDEKPTSPYDRRYSYDYEGYSWEGRRDELD